MKGRVLVAGATAGPLLRLERPLSFWGGIDADSGCVIAPGHPQEGRYITGHVIALERSIGSSSGSSVLLELLYRGRGPLGIILAESDQILALGVLVAREIGIAGIPVIQLSHRDFECLPSVLSIAETGEISASG